MTRKELAGGLGTTIDILNKICNDLGIRNKELQDEEIVDIKIKYLDLYKNKILKQRDELKDDQNQFEEYKREEKNKLKEKQIQDELEHNQKLAEMSIKKLEELSSDFQEKLSKEYEVIKEKFIEISKKESENQEKEIKYESFKIEKKLFDSKKEKLLNEYLQKLEIDKEIFWNKQKEEELKQLEKNKKNRDSLYKSKETEIEEKEKEIRTKEAELKTKMAEVKAKEKSLETQSESIYRQEQEKVQEEIKNYLEKISSFERQNHVLREDLSNLREELGEQDRFEDRKLREELNEKQREISRLKKSLEDTTEERNVLSIHLDSQSSEHKKEKQSFENEKNRLLQDNLEVESLKSNKSILDDKILSKDNHIEFLQGEKRKLEEDLHSIFSQGKEIELRVEDIKRKPFSNKELKEEVTITDEIKWLDSMEKNMKKYGVEYPKRLLYSFHTALKSAEYSPLSVLSGVSGTGKSELPKLYSHFGGFNFINEAVQPTWDSPESMMGYYNTIESKFDSTNILKFLLQTSQSKDETPFGWKESMNMILLDEMNLAHIELYFAEFLSKFEQRRGSKGVNIDIKLGTGMNYPLPLDRNVLWIGTMNEDETTKSLSDKVLDRSFSINFPRPDKLLSRGVLKDLDEIKQFEYLHKDTWTKWVQKESLFVDDKKEILEKYREISNKINQELTPTGRAIGHRVWQSMEYYINNHPLVIQNINDDDLLKKNVKLAFEEQLVQKIMPKLRGIETHGKEKDVLSSIRDILHKDDFKITEDFELSMDNPYGQFIWNSANYLKED